MGAETFPDPDAFLHLRTAAFPDNSSSSTCICSFCSLLCRQKQSGLISRSSCQSGSKSGILHFQQRSGQEQNGQCKASQKSSRSRSYGAGSCSVRAPAPGSLGFDCTVSLSCRSQEGPKASTILGLPDRRWRLREQNFQQEVSVIRTCPRSGLEQAERCEQPRLPDCP